MEIINREQALDTLKERKERCLLENKTVELRWVKRKIREVESMPAGTDLLARCLESDTASVIGLNTRSQMRNKAIQAIQEGRDFILLYEKGGNELMDTILTCYGKNQTLSRMIDAAMKVSES